MADSKTAQEPSMEEILSSIRRIIAEDEPGGPATAGPGQPTAELPLAGLDADDEDDDVLELTEVVGEPEPFAAPIKAAAATAAPSPSQPPPVADMLENPPMPAQAVDTLMSPTAASASANAFARLTKAVATDETRTEAAAGVTVEQLLVDLLTPMLRDWLDKNLPEIVERVVEQEVKKLARRAELM